MAWHIVREDTSDADIRMMIVGGHITPIICNSCPPENISKNVPYFVGTRAKENFQATIAYDTIVVSIGDDRHCPDCDKDAIYMYMIDPNQKVDLCTGTKDAHPSIYNVTRGN